MITGRHRNSTEPGTSSNSTGLNAYVYRQGQALTHDHGRFTEPLNKSSSTPADTTATGQDVAPLPHLGLVFLTRLDCRCAVAPSAHAVRLSARGRDLPPSTTAPSPRLLRVAARQSHGCH